MKHVELTDEELSVLIDLTALIPGNQGQVLKEKLTAAASPEPSKAWMEKMFGDRGYEQLNTVQLDRDQFIRAQRPVYPDKKEDDNGE